MQKKIDQAISSGKIMNKKYRLDISTITDPDTLQKKLFGRHQMIQAAENNSFVADVVNATGSKQVLMDDLYAALNDTAKPQANMTSADIATGVKQRVQEINNELEETR